MYEKDGWWLPDILGGHGKYMRRAEVVDYALQFSTRRRRAVQAGAHIGTFPARLSPHFERVDCFEPVSTNWECLERNVAEYLNVTCHRAALADACRDLVVNINARSTGGHHITKRTDLPFERTGAMTVDSYGWQDVDAIFLDVEGYELHALLGAAATIRHSRPLIVAEVNSCRDRYNVKGSVEEFLCEQRGYDIAGSYGEDLIFVP